MARKSMRMLFLVPILALMCALACAPAAFASEVGDLQAVHLQDANMAYGVGADLEKATFEFVDSADQPYTGSAITPHFKVILNGVELKGSEDFKDPNADYGYFYLNNVDVSAGQTDINYKPQVFIATFDNEDNMYTMPEYFNIVPADIAQVKATATNEVYTGKKAIPETVATFNGTTLQKNTDYTVSYWQKVKVKKKGKTKKVYKKATPKKVGTYYVRIDGKGNFTGSKYVKFKVTPASIKSAKFSNVKDKEYTGDRLTPSVKVKFNGKKLKKGRDYTVKYKNNLNVGVATITVKGKGNLKGTQKIKFAVTPCPISKATANFKNPQLWTGSVVTPDPMLTYKGHKLSAGTDFTVHYSDNRNENMSSNDSAKMRVYGKGNFTGSTTFSFKIKYPTMDDTTITVSNTTKGQAPVVTVKYANRTLVNKAFDQYNWDYEVNLGDYNTTGTATATITGDQFHFFGSKTVKYKVS